MISKLFRSAVFALSLGASGAALAQPAPTPPSPELTQQAGSILNLANDLAAEVARAAEGWLTSNAVTEDRLFSRFYYPQPNSSPPRFTTDYDALADRDFAAAQERVIAKSPLIVFAVFTDVNGYVPTHNARFSQPLTGNRATDLENNRSKRLATEPYAIRAARNQGTYLLQQYRLANGDMVAEISVPVRVKGRHFGCVRIAYRADR